jgi:hypothetical protein
LLAICAVINYLDRGNLSIAAPLLKDELHISASQLGILLSAFFLDLHRQANAAHVLQAIRRIP